MYFSHFQSRQVLFKNRSTSITSNRFSLGTKISRILRVSKIFWLRVRLHNMMMARFLLQSDWWKKRFKNSKNNYLLGKNKLSSMKIANYYTANSFCEKENTLGQMAIWLQVHWVTPSRCIFGIFWASVERIGWLKKLSVALSLSWCLILAQVYK